MFFGVQSRPHSTPAISLSEDTDLTIYFSKLAEVYNSHLLSGGLPYVNSVHMN